MRRQAASQKRLTASAKLAINKHAGREAVVALGADVRTGKLLQESLTNDAGKSATQSDRALLNCHLTSAERTCRDNRPSQPVPEHSGRSLDGKVTLHPPLAEPEDMEQIV